MNDSTSKQKQFQKIYMQTAWLYANVSKDLRKKVGAVLVTETGILIPGYNGIYAGGSNENQLVLESGELVTKQEVIHAELNCVLKAAKEGVSVVNSMVYVTMSPCLSCSSMLIQSGVKSVCYDENYRDLSGIELLKSAGIEVTKI